MKAITFPFRFDLSGKVAECPSYEDVVRCQVIDAVMTNQGERVMRPRYGCDIQSALFDPTDELVLHDAASYIKERLSRLVSRALIRSVRVTSDASIHAFQSPEIHSAPGMVTVTISYRPSLYATDVSLTVPVSSEFLSRQRLSIEQGSEI